MSRIAFIDVDTQVDFMTPEGALYVPGAEELVDNLERLLSLAEEKEIPVIATADDHPEDDPEFEIFPPHCVQGTPGQKKIGTTAGRCRELVTKQTYDAWSNPRMAELVDEIGADTWVVFGVATDYCVKAAASGLLDRALRVLLVTDAIKPVTAEDGKAALEELSRRGARLVTTDEVERYVEAQEAGVA